MIHLWKVRWLRHSWIGTSHKYIEKKTSFVPFFFFFFFFHLAYHHRYLTTGNSWNRRFVYSQSSSVSIRLVRAHSNALLSISQYRSPSLCLSRVDFPRFRFSLTITFILSYAKIYTNIRRFGWHSLCWQIHSICYLSYRTLGQSSINVDPQFVVSMNKFSSGMKMIILKKILLLNDLSVIWMDPRFFFSYPLRIELREGRAANVNFNGLENISLTYFVDCLNIWNQLTFDYSHDQ